jgi:DNA helicase HerA-like ATPase
MTELLGSRGNIRLGLATGHEDVPIQVPADEKAVLPRHFGVLGTTGGGKTTTVSNFMAELQQAKAAVILFDTEGEYTTVDQPTDNAAMRASREARGLSVNGIPNTMVYHLVGREPANTCHPNLRTFGLRFSSLSPWTLKEILDLSDAQETRFMEAYDATKLALRQLGIFPQFKNEDEERAAMEVDELETGWPRLTLQHLLYVSSGMTNAAAGNDDEPWYAPVAFRGQWKQIKQLIAQSGPKNQISWRALMARLYRLHRLRLFDQPNADEPDYAAMLKPGHVTIVDLSDLDSPAICNLAIAQILQGLQRQQDENYERLSVSDQRLTLAMVLIEEAHEFLSAERVRQMPVLFQQVARIARRGRKRWLGLGFITQLPQHLPDEVFALINNWILHKIQDVNVINRLRKVIPGVDEGMWRSLPAQPPGQAIVSFTHLKRPVTVSMDASPCRLRMVD